MRRVWTPLLASCYEAVWGVNVAICRACASCVGVDVCHAVSWILAWGQKSVSSCAGGILQGVWVVICRKYRVLVTKDVRQSIVACLASFLGSPLSMMAFRLGV